MRRARARRVGVVMWLTALLVGAWTPAAAVEPLPSFAAVRDQLTQALIPAAAADLEAHADDPLYRIRATYDPATHALDGHLRVEYRNRSEDTLSDLGLYTFANSPAFHGAALSLSHVAVNGQAVRCQAIDQGADQLIALPRPVVPGQLLVLTAAFHLSCSTTAGDNGLDEDSAGQACLYAWYPVIARRDAGSWQLHPLDALTDPCALDMAHVLLELTVPEGLRVASGGSQVGSRPSTAGGTIVTIAAPFTRDLAVVIAPQLQVQSAAVGATTVDSWSSPALASYAQRSLTVASRALALYGHFGLYPYRHLSVVQTPMSDDAQGMESSGLILISSLIPAQLGADAGDAKAARALTFIYGLVVSHEVAHQWFYNLVGSDPYLNPWLDESLADWSDNFYLEGAGDGIPPAAGWQQSAMDVGMNPALTKSATGSVDSYGGRGEDYECVVYSRGGLMYQALRQALGPERFLAFLRTWVADHRYQVADQAAWRAAIIQALGDTAGRAFIHHWLEGAGLTAQDITSAATVCPPLFPVSP